jgi:hypothetical protein
LLTFWRDASSTQFCEEFRKKANSLRSENDFKRIVGTRQDWRCRDGRKKRIHQWPKFWRILEKAEFISSQNFKEFRKKQNFFGATSVAAPRWFQCWSTPWWTRDDSILLDAGTRKNGLWHPAKYGCSVQDLDEQVIRRLIRIEEPAWHHRGSSWPLNFCKKLDENNADENPRSWRKLSFIFDCRWKTSSWQFQQF